MLTLPIEGEQSRDLWVKEVAVDCVANDVESEEDGVAIATPHAQH